jgi:hypothetical protein
LASEGKVAIGDAFFAEDFEFPVFLLLFFFPVAGASDLPTGMSSVICSRTFLACFFSFWGLQSFYLDTHLQKVGLDGHASFTLANCHMVLAGSSLWIVTVLLRCILNVQ